MSKLARLYPDLVAKEAIEGLAVRELTLLQRLASGLPDAFRVYHGIHWSRIEQGHTAIGRIQFLVLSPAGTVFLLTMKTGLMRLHAGRLVKRLNEQDQDPFEEMAQLADHLNAKWQTNRDERLPIECVFYCPDFRVSQARALAANQERIFDASRSDRLVSWLSEFDASIGNQNPDLFAGARPQAAELHRFLCNELDLQAEVRELSREADLLVTRLTEGLGQWVSRLDFEPFRLRINGTAGSGKSQLALRELRQASADKFRALYVCFNRPLAAHMSRIISEQSWMGVQAYNFHALCDRILSDNGLKPDYSDPNTFRNLPIRVLNLPADKRWVFDVVVVDEGQDFESLWLQVLQRLSHEHTRWIWLEDITQNLYDKPRLELSGWVNLTVPTNYRNPVRIVNAIQALQNTLPQAKWTIPSIEAACPVLGLPFEYFSYDSEVGLKDQVAKAITGCLKRGFSRDQIVLLSMRGQERSVLMKLEQVGPHDLRHFTGRYDSQGQPVFTQGAVQTESVYRFKGQSAPAVIIAELDWSEWTLQEFRKLFVAMTRSTMSLSFVGGSAAIEQLKLWFQPENPA